MQDHRKLGRDLELFHSDPLVGAGLPLWLPAGAAARRAVEDYLHALERRNGYQHVYSPPLAKQEMYVRSGHLPHFADDMFPPMALSEHDAFVLRPSLARATRRCSARAGRSYRELPLRIARSAGSTAPNAPVSSVDCPVRAISLNDGHVFCAREQVDDEVVEALRLMRAAHAALGFQPSSVPAVAARRGRQVRRRPAMWDGVGGAREALEAAGVSYVEAAGEAAFYGPKIDVQLLDHAGRETPWRPCRSTTSSRPGSTCPMWTPTGPAPPGHGAPQRGRQHGTALRAPDRGPRRRVPGLVRAAAGGRAPRLRRLRGRRLPARLPRRRPAGRGVARGEPGRPDRQAVARKVPFVAVVGERRPRTARCRCAHGTRARCRGCSRSGPRSPHCPTCAGPHKQTAGAGASVQVCGSSGSS